jgi:hypothetical protein
VRILIDKDGERYRWRLVRRTPSGADVLARGVRGYLDERDCYLAAAALAEVSAEGMLVVQQRDGHWRWIAHGADGVPLAESPATYRDAAACGRALAVVRREVATLPVAG